MLPRSINQVFGFIENNSDREFVLRVSYLEIYNETVNDLLQPNSCNLRIFNSKDGVKIVGLEEVLVVSQEQVFSLIAAGESHRHVGSTSYNKKSSRSHTIFRMVIESRCAGADGKAIVDAYRKR